MAAPAAAPPQLSWLVQVPDKAGAHVSQARRDHLADHLAYNKTHIDAGRMVMAGPIVDAPPGGPVASPPTVTGSLMVWRASSEADMHSWLGQNPYATAGVWDLNKVVCTQFLCAVRTAM